MAIPGFDVKMVVDEGQPLVALRVVSEGRVSDLFSLGSIVARDVALRIIAACDAIDADLTGRQSHCMCNAVAPSAVTLPFFERRPDQAYDSHYCGCRGWE